MNDFMNQQMYMEHILDLYRNPNNFGRLENPDINERCFNPSCGDEIEIQARISDKKIEEVEFIGRGCALSVAAASLLTDYIKGKSLSKIKDMTQDDMVNLVGIEVGPARIKCITCSLVSLRDGIRKFMEDENVRS